MSQPPFPHHESIRVVPLYQPKSKVSFDINARGVTKKKVRAEAKLTYRGGPLISNIEVFTIFWGADWNNLPLKETADKLNEFFKTILQSTLMDELSEYNTPSYTIGKGTLKGTIATAEKVPVQSITDTEIQSQLQEWITSNPGFPKPSLNTLYFIYLENGISVSMGGSQSCSSFCGYHNSINDSIFYSVMPYPVCAGCLGKMKPFDALTATSSHELCEAITDPIPGSGWYDDHYGEIGDICAWKFKTLEGYQVQTEWSNSKNNCI